MAELVVASNRGPLSFRLDNGEPVAAGTGGGLAGTLRPLLAGTGAIWVAASMTEADRLAVQRGLMVGDGIRIVPVALDHECYRMAYDVVANSTLWFAYHHLFDLPRRPRFDRHWHEAWRAYRQLNAAFAETVAKVAPRGAAVLVQDYHLSLTGRMLAQRRPDLRTVHFLHVPFPPPEYARVLPDAVLTELLDGMAGFGACGFHTRRWEAAFRRCYEDPDATVSRGVPINGEAAAFGAPRTFVSPLGPTPDALLETARSPEARAAGQRLSAEVGSRRLIVRVDRMEVSKNLLRGFWAFEELLDRYPRWREQVVFVALAYPSRASLAEYIGYRSEVEHAVARINETWGTPNWTPIIFDVADDHPRSVAAMSRYDVLLVNPVRDGLNMVAKEGPILNETDGAVVLSFEAGAFEELAPAVIAVNPFDVTQTAEALRLALEMDPGERKRRAHRLRQLVQARTASDWLADQLAAASEAPR